MAAHFVTGPFQPHKVFLPDDEYGRALDCLIKACFDILMTKRGPQGETLVLLARRKVHPQPDWWFVGGRGVPGETPQEAAKRHLKRELNLNLSAEDANRRFEIVGHYSLVWAYRAQPPADHGTADISTVQSIEVSEAESASFIFCDKEYRGSQWLEISKIIENSDFHPTLRRSCADLLMREAMKKLRKIIDDKSSSSELIAEAAKELVERQKIAESLPTVVEKVAMVEDP